LQWVMRQFKNPWEPHGLALLDFFHGKTDTKVIVHSDGGEKTDFPIRIFFRRLQDFTPLEKKALALCRGRILDIGAGAGCHSLHLQNQGLSVCCIDIRSEAVEVMVKQGLKDVRCTDFYSLRQEKFDTLLMMMNGIGIVETLSGLNRFLKESYRLLKPNGQILLDSVDLRHGENPDGTGDQDSDSHSGKYFGEIRLQLEYGGVFGPPLECLFVDPDTLSEMALNAGWSCQVIFREDDGGYLAQLAPHPRK